MPLQPKSVCPSGDTAPLEKPQRQTLDKPFTEEAALMN